MCIIQIRLRYGMMNSINHTKSKSQIYFFHIIENKDFDTFIVFEYLKVINFYFRVFKRYSYEIL